MCILFLTNRRLGSNELGMFDRMSRMIHSEGILSHPFFSTIDWNAMLRKEIVVPFRPPIEGPLDYSYFDRMVPGVRVIQRNDA